MSYCNTTLLVINIIFKKSAYIKRKEITHQIFYYQANSEKNENIIPIVNYVYLKFLLKTELRGVSDGGGFHLEVGVIFTNYL